MYINAVNLMCPEYWSHCSREPSEVRDAAFSRSSGPSIDFPPVNECPSARDACLCTTHRLSHPFISSRKGAAASHRRVACGADVDVSASVYECQCVVGSVGLHALGGGF